jgi:hypothetical protein
MLLAIVIAFRRYRPIILLGSNVITISRQASYLSAGRRL